MLIKVTNFCSMGCSHCMEDSTIKGEHMTDDVFGRALDFTERVEGPAYKAGIPRVLLLSGGECTEHPEFVKLLETAIARRWHKVMLITNGTWLGNAELRDAILRPEWKELLVQVVNDPRFYPTPVPKWDDPRLMFADYVPMLIRLGRGARRKPKADDPEARKYPGSFNLRSLVRSLRSFSAALTHLRASAKECAPAISSNGELVAGETNSCWKIGTVDSTEREVTENVLAMGTCNRCGLEDNLGQAHRRAIGLSTLFLPTE